jgi:DNA-binding winged helix-turn-helix (wHTH) protein
MSEFSYDSTPFANGAELEVGEWQIYPALNRIARRGEFVQLQNLSMQVLMHLSRQPGVVATYEELLDALWPGRFVAEDAVHRRIADLRRHLNDNARSPRYIETIPKRGYRIIASVQRPTCRVRHRLPLRRSAIIVALAAAMVVLIVVAP